MIRVDRNKKFANNTKMGNKTKFAYTSKLRQKANFVYRELSEILLKEVRT